MASNALHAAMYWRDISMNATSATKTASQSRTASSGRTMANGYHVSNSTSPAAKISSGGAPNVKIEGLDRIAKSWDKLLKEFPAKRREFLERMGQQLLADVRREIGGEGKVAGWQEKHMGSRGGYVAIRAAAKTYQTTMGGKRYAVGYVTNAIENGHRVRTPAVRGAKGYRSRAEKAAVPGRWFYQTVRQRLDGLDDREVEALMELIQTGLEGNL